MSNELKVLVKLFSTEEQASDGSTIPRKSVEEYLSSSDYQLIINDKLSLGGVTHKDRKLNPEYEGVVGMDDQVLINDNCTHYISKIFFKDNDPFIYAILRVFDPDKFAGKRKDNIINLRGLLESGVKPPVSVVIQALWSPSNVAERIIRVKGCDYTQNPAFDGAGVQKLMSNFESVRLVEESKLFSDTSENKLLEGCKLMTKTFSADIIDLVDVIDEIDLSRYDYIDRIEQRYFDYHGFKNRGAWLLNKLRNLVKSGKKDEVPETKNTLDEWVKTHPDEPISGSKNSLKHDNQVEDTKVTANQFFHITPVENVKSILDQGLKSSKGAGENTTHLNEGRKGLRRIYLTSDWKLLMKYDSEYPYSNKNYALLEIKLTNDQKSRLKADEEDTGIDDDNDDTDPNTIYHWHLDDEDIQPSQIKLLGKLYRAVIKPDGTQKGSPNKLIPCTVDELIPFSDTNEIVFSRKEVIQKYGASSPEALSTKRFSIITVSDLKRLAEDYRAKNEVPKINPDKEVITIPEKLFNHKNVIDDIPKDKTQLQLDHLIKLAKEIVGTEDSSLIQTVFRNNRPMFIQMMNSIPEDEPNRDDLLKDSLNTFFRVIPQTAEFSTINSVRDRVLMDKYPRFALINRILKSYKSYFDTKKDSLSNSELALLKTLLIQDINILMKRVQDKIKVGSNLNSLFALTQFSPELARAGVRLSKIYRQIIISEEVLGFIPSAKYLVWTKYLKEFYNELSKYVFEQDYDETVKILDKL